jgi:hypothetical protein
MKKKNLKSLRLTKSTISSLTAKTLNGGTDIFTIAIGIAINYATIKGCSLLAVCDSDQICPAGVPKTRFVDIDTKPASACIRDMSSVYIHRRLFKFFMITRTRSSYCLLTFYHY